MFDVLAIANKMDEALRSIFGKNLQMNMSVSADGAVIKTVINGRKIEITLKVGPK